MPKPTEFKNVRESLSRKQELIDGHKQNIATLKETLAMLKVKSSGAGGKAVKEIIKVMQIDINMREEVIRRLGNLVNNFKSNLQTFK